jgi:CRP-like cAMP-binding protein
MSPEMPKGSAKTFNSSVRLSPLPRLKDLIQIPITASRRNTQNELLANLSVNLYARLEPFLHKVSFQRGQTIFEPAGEIDFIYFPDNLIASRLVVMQDGSMIEVGMFGHEAMLGIRGLLESDKTQCLTVAENEGTALKIDAKKLKQFFKSEPELQTVFLQFYGKFITQISQRSACRCRHTISKQLCTWLLQFQERACTNELALTQETIAQRLGARRSSITVAINELEEKKLICCGRGNIEIMDRMQLAQEACECYMTLNCEQIKNYTAKYFH